jgi:hypothetical protein
MEMDSWAEAHDSGENGVKSETVGKGG